MNMDKTYVHDGKEVRLTGRAAKKEGNGRKATTILVEIVPLECDSNDPKFCKWVQMKELSEIINLTK